MRGHVVQIWNRHGVHRGKLVAGLCRRVPRLHLEFLPASAPELNPGKGVWRQSKHRLANNCPADRVDLALDVLRELEALRCARPDDCGAVSSTQDLRL